jgi:hypothetical protein
MERRPHVTGFDAQCLVSRSPHGDAPDRSRASGSRALRVSLPKVARLDAIGGERVTFVEQARAE